MGYACTVITVLVLAGKVHSVYSGGSLEATFFMWPWLSAVSSLNLVFVPFRLPGDVPFRSSSKCFILLIVRTGSSVSWFLLVLLFILPSIAASGFVPKNYYSS
jgi:hypothetical protein